MLLSVHAINAWGFLSLIFFLFCGIFHYDLSILSSLFCCPDPCHDFLVIVPGHTCKTFSKFRALWHQSCVRERQLVPQHRCTSEPHGGLSKLPQRNCPRLLIRAGGRREEPGLGSFGRSPTDSYVLLFGSHAATDWLHPPEGTERVFQIRAVPCSISSCAGWVFLWFCISTLILYGSI